MSQDEHLPEELNDCQRVLASLVPRASRIDRDRLMVRLGEQSAARGSTRWKGATAASLLLALVVGLRPLIVPPGSVPAQLAIQHDTEVPRSIHPEVSRNSEPDEGAPPAAVRPIGDEGDWLLALASARFHPSGMLTVRPQSASALLASRTGDAPEPLDVSPDTPPRHRAPILRWGDRPLQRETVDLAVPPTS